MPFTGLVSPLQALTLFQSCWSPIRSCGRFSGALCFFESCIFKAILKHWSLYRTTGPFSGQLGYLGDIGTFSKIFVPCFSCSSNFYDVNSVTAIKKNPNEGNIWNKLKNTIELFILLGLNLYMRQFTEQCTFQSQKLPNWNVYFKSVFFG